MKKSASILFIISTIFVSSVTAEAIDYKITALETPDGCYSSIANDINDNGDVVGYVEFKKTSGGFVRYPTIWDKNGKVKTIPVTINYWDASAQSVNNNGQVVGWSKDAFAWSDGTDLTTASYTKYYAISDTGWYGGSYNKKAYAWDAAGNVYNIGNLPGMSESLVYGINDFGLAVGYSGIPSQIKYKAFKWTSNGGIQEISGFDGDSTLAEAVNNKGEIVGYSKKYTTTWGNYDIRACLWDTDGNMIDLTSFLSNKTSYSAAHAINENGDIGGNNYFRPLIWSGTNHQENILPILNNNNSGTVLGINNNGIAVGYCYTSGAPSTDYPMYATLWTPVPEPSSVVALITGIG